MNALRGHTMRREGAYHLHDAARVDDEARALLRSLANHARSLRKLKAQRDRFHAYRAAKKLTTTT